MALAVILLRTPRVINSSHRGQYSRSIDLTRSVLFRSNISAWFLYFDAIFPFLKSRQFCCISRKNIDSNLILITGKLSFQKVIVIFQLLFYLTELMLSVTKEVIPFFYRLYICMFIYIYIHVYHKIALNKFSILLTVLSKHCL